MAVFREDLVRLVFHGNYHASATSTSAAREEFVHTLMLHLNMDGIIPTPDWTTLVNTAASKAAEKFASHWSGSPSIASYYSNLVRYHRVDAYHLDVNGLALHHGVAAMPTEVVGTQTTCLPPECAVVVSLRPDPSSTVFVNPGRRRGRFYLPAPSAAALAANGDLSTTFQNTVLSWAQSLINDIQGMHLTPTDSSTSHWDVVIASGREGTTAQVGEIRVGAVMDAQRRRRRSLPESYVSATISHS